MKDKERQIGVLKQRQVQVMCLVKENNKQFNELISVLTEVVCELSK